jgi:transposase InsO family protein
VRVRSAEESRDLCRALLAIGRLIRGKIERLFRTFKETVFRYIWVFTSLRQLDRWSADFVRYYNRDRPHASYGGLTPDEVAAGAREPSPARRRVTYFDGHLHWYAFG